MFGSIISCGTFHLDEKVFNPEFYAEQNKNHLKPRIPDPIPVFCTGESLKPVGEQLENR